MDVLAMFVLPAIAGVAIGILSGLLGIGGGTVMVPSSVGVRRQAPSFHGHVAVRHYSRVHIGRGIPYTP